MGLKLRKRLAVIGCGKIFRKHLESIKILEKKRKLKLVAICDQNKNLINSIKIQKVKKYLNSNEMLSKEKIDIISILTPSGLHYHHAIQFAGKVKCVILEKPIALKISDAKKLIRTFKKKKTKLFIVLQNRFNEPVVELKKAIETGMFGDILLITARLRWSRDADYYLQAKWRGTWKLDGGVVANQSAHFIDLIQWLFGMPDSVFSRIRQKQKIKKKVEDTAVSIFEYKNKKKLALLEATNAIRPKNLEGSISVVGKNGTVVVGGMSADKLISWTLKKNKIINKLLKVNHKSSISSHTKFYQYVVDHFNKKNNFFDGKEALKSLILINSIYRSSQEKTSFKINNVKNSFLGNKKNFKLKINL